MIWIGITIALIKVTRIVVHQRTWWIRDQSGLVDSFVAVALKPIFRAFSAFHDNAIFYSSLTRNHPQNSRFSYTLLISLIHQILNLYHVRWVLKSFIDERPAVRRLEYLVSTGGTGSTFFLGSFSFSSSWASSSNDSFTIALLSVFRVTVSVGFTNRTAWFFFTGVPGLPGVPGRPREPVRALPFTKCSLFSFCLIEASTLSMSSISNSSLSRWTMGGHFGDDCSTGSSINPVIASESSGGSTVRVFP